MESDEYEHIFTQIPDSSILEILPELDKLSLENDQNKNLSKKPFLPPEILKMILNLCDFKTCRQLINTSRFFWFELLYGQNTCMFAGVKDLSSFLMSNRFKPPLQTRVDVSKRKIVIEGSVKTLRTFLGNDFQKDFGMSMEKNNMVTVNINIFSQTSENAIEIWKFINIIHRKYKILQGCNIYSRKNYCGIRHLSGAETELQDEVVRRICFKRTKRCRCRSEDNYLCDACRVGCCVEAESDWFYVSCKKHPEKTIQVASTS